MAGNTKALRGRIKSVSSTLQLTKAMGLVASSKIRRAGEAMAMGREYACALDRSLDLLTSHGDCQNSPYMRKGETDRVKIIVIAGDRGLAGGYNANVFRLAADYPMAEFVPIGKRACEKYGKSVVSSEYFSFEDAGKLADALCGEFEESAWDRLGIIYTKYRSVMIQDARIQWLLPFSKGERTDAVGMIFEPDPITVFHRVAKEYLAGKILALVRESFASEVAARRMAMDSAGKNAGEMIEKLQLAYNRARQGAITQEITEIVAGSGNG